MESLRLFFTHFTDTSITASLSVLAIIGVGIIALWLYNRKKLHQLSHQIPASVVKHYLDSIIQNSQSLKSSLFRGGGLDISEGIPSVVPASGLSASGSEDVNRKVAEISSLTQRLMEKEKIISDLEKKLVSMPAVAGAADQSEEVDLLKNEVARLQKELAAKGEQPASSGGGDSTQLKKELSDVTRERDELKERLLEYEIIEEDLANLKRLQQENEQLKTALGQAGGAVAAVAVAPKAKAVEPETVEEEAAVEEAPAMEEPEAKTEEAPAAAMEEQSDGDSTPDAPPQAAAEGDQKSAEELLSEFEKMLG